MAKDENKESEIRGDEQEIVDQRLPVWRPQDADREYYRYETKKRIQHYTVPPQTIFRPAKPTPTIRDAEHKRVAVYARVSTKSKEQVSSIENQTKYYTEKIAKTPNWDLAEIYSDEGKSGTSKKWRPEFKRMLEDASKKKMDLIVCASVSRFARNISDLIEEVRKLRTTNPSNPVGVYFETEDLYTLDPNINERLQMQGLFAEWESGNKSRRMILSYDQRICTGQFPLSDLLGLRHTIEGGFIIEEEEAKTVKYIFLATLCGYTAEEIAEVLTDKQRPTLRGRTEWTASMVKAIMENERRWGDLEVRKRVVIDYKEKVTAKNDGLREGAYIPHYHEGIVSPEIARAAHKLIMLGDLFDRGHEAKQLQQFILEQMEQDKIILIRGNHEDLFVELVTTDAGMPYSYHKSNGTYDTALQLTGFDPVMASIRHYDFADAAKDTPFYKEIIPAMLDYFETEHYVFTHGWIPSIPNRDKSYSYISSWREADREQWNQARWFNGMDAAQTADENKTIVCGHWHTSYGHSKYEHKGTEFGEDADFSPYYGPGIIAIDACTAFSGKVNCLVIED